MNVTLQLQKGDASGSLHPTTKPAKPNLERIHTRHRSSRCCPPHCRRDCGPGGMESRQRGAYPRAGQSRTRTDARPRPASAGHTRDRRGNVNQPPRLWSKTHTKALGTHLTWVGGLYSWAFMSSTCHGGGQNEHASSRVDCGSQHALGRANQPANLPTALRSRGSELPNRERSIRTLLVGTLPHPSGCRRERAARTRARTHLCDCYCRGAQ